MWREAVFSFATFADCLCMWHGGWQHGAVCTAALHCRLALHAVMQHEQPKRTGQGCSWCAWPSLTPPLSHSLSSLSPSPSPLPLLLIISYVPLMKINYVEAAAFVFTVSPACLIWAFLAHPHPCSLPFHLSLSISSPHSVWVLFHGCCLWWWLHLC